VKIAGVLLEAGIDVNREALSEGTWKATPLWYAVGRGEPLALVTHSLTRGASPEHALWAASYRNDLAAIRLLAEHGARIDAVAEDETPFLFAVTYSHCRTAERLLRPGAHVDFQNSRKMTALHYMLRKASPEQHVRPLVKHGARGDLPNGAGVTACQIMSRTRFPGFRKMAAAFAAGARRAV
jgi:hypothetical protein